MNSTQQSLIDSYLRNELSAAELSSFESLMESDPAFREEVRFEEHVKEGIGQFRKAELKARLDAIDVAPTWIGMGQLGNSTVIKTVGALVTAGIIGTAGYFMLNADREETVSTVHSEPIAADYPVQYAYPKISISENPTEVERSEDVFRADIEEVAMNQRSNSSVSASTFDRVEGEDHEAEPVDTDEFVPQVEVPGLNEVESEEAFVSVNVEMPEASATDEISSTALVPLDVKTISRRSEEIKYKYFDGKLYLYGDFKQQPYEILEINGVSERKIYVFYNKNYYKVELTDKVEDLTQITNEKLIRELEILRNNKLAE